MNSGICTNCGWSFNVGDSVCRHCGYAVSDSHVTFPAGTILGGKYEVQELMHTGGMSCIYLVRDKSLFQRVCIVKQIKEPIQSEEHRQRLEEEALRMAKLCHPGIAMILDHFVEHGYYFLVVEHVHGKSLSEVHKQRQEPLTEDEVVGWGAAICNVITYIHSEGVIHRDISPDNIMLTQEGSIKFIDFGTSRELQHTNAGGTAGMGKYGYTPPEQWQGKPRPQSDIFALGATMYYLLTGYLPLSKSYRTGKAPRKQDYFPKFPPVRTHNRGVSSELQTILQKALQLNPNQRYRSAAEMREALSWKRLEANSSGSYSPETVVLPDNRSEAVRAELQHQSKSLKDPGFSSKAVRINQIKPIVFSGAAIRKKTISDVLQHPSTLLPLVVCAASTGYLLLLSPIYGGALATLIIIPVSGIAGLVSFFSRYPKEYQENARQLMSMAEEQRQELEQAELDKTRYAIHSGFIAVDSTRGTKSLNDLTNEYVQLKKALAQQRLTDPLSLSVIPSLAEETYRRGLSVLSDALDLTNVLHMPSREKIEREIKVIGLEIEALQNDRNQAERLKLKLQVLESLSERLDGHSKVQLWVEQLLFQAQRCEASLHAARIELATVRAGSTKASVDSVIATLQERINGVREVQEELTKMGF